MRDELLGVGRGLAGLGRVVLQDEVDLLAVDAARGVDAVDVDAQRLNGRRVGAGRWSCQRARQADVVGILRGGRASEHCSGQHGACQFAKHRLSSHVDLECFA